VRNIICVTECSSAILLHSMHHGVNVSAKYPVPTIPCEATSGQISNDGSGAGKKQNIMSEFER